MGVQREPEVGRPHAEQAAGAIKKCISTPLFLKICNPDSFSSNARPTDEKLQNKLTGLVGVREIIGVDPKENQGVGGLIRHGHIGQ